MDLSMVHRLANPFQSSGTPQVGADSVQKQRDRKPQSYLYIENQAITKEQDLLMIGLAVRF